MSKQYLRPVTEEEIVREQVRHIRFCPVCGNPFQRGQNIVAYRVGDREAPPSTENTRAVHGSCLKRAIREWPLPSRDNESKDLGVRRRIGKELRSRCTVNPMVVAPRTPRAEVRARRKRAEEAERARIAALKEEAATHSEDPFEEGGVEPGLAGVIAHAHGMSGLGPAVPLVTYAASVGRPILGKPGAIAWEPDQGRMNKLLERARTRNAT